MRSSEAANHVVIFTALNVETAAVLQQLTGPVRPRFVGEMLYQEAHLSLPNGDIGWRVDVAMLGAGNIDAAAEAARAQAALHPDVLLFVGIAGALKDLDIGDVVAANEVAWSERARVTAGARELRPRVESCSRELVALAGYTVGRDAWQSRLSEERVRNLPRKLRAYVGQILSGEELVKDSAYKQKLRRDFSDALAVENEGYGIARAGGASSKVLVIRAASDAADESKSDKDHGLAAEAAAAFAAALLLDYSEVLALTAASGAAPDVAEQMPDGASPVMAHEASSALNTLLTDVDLVEDNEAAIAALAETDAQTLTEVACLDLVASLAGEVDASTNTLVARRIRYYARHLSAVLHRSGALKGLDLDALLLQAPVGSATMLAQPAVFPELTPRVRRRVLSGLLGPPTAPRPVTPLAWQYLSSLRAADLLTPEEGARFQQALLAAQYTDLLDSGMALKEMLPKVLEDLSSGNFQQQNAAARFVSRLDPSDADLTTSSDDEERLGIQLVVAAAEGAFGASEATAYAQALRWSPARLAGGIAGALTRGREWLSTPTEQLGPLLAAAAVTGRLDEALNRAKSILTVHLTEPTARRRVASVVDDMISAGERLDSEAAQPWQAFTRWLEANAPIAPSGRAPRPD